MAQRGRPRKDAPQAEQATLADAADVADSPSPEKRLQDYPRHERDTADKVHGQALFELGRQYGLPRSSMERMDTDKLRRQIKIAQSLRLQDELSGHAVA